MAYPLARSSYRCRSASGDKVTITSQADGIDRVYVTCTNVGGHFADVSLPPKVARALAAEIIRQANLIEGEQP